jgi:hypothetical protein
MVKLKKLYLLIVIITLIILAARTPTSLFDYDSYYTHFATWNLNGLWELYFDYFTHGEYLTGLARLISEEIGWYLWVLFLNSFLEPNTAIIITTLLISVLIFISIYRLNNSILLLFLWLILPVGLSVIGTYQIRQGFAFAIFMFVSSSMKSILPSLVLASMIHTTFAIPLLVALLLEAQKFIVNIYSLILMRIKFRSRFLIFVSKFTLTLSSISVIILALRVFQYLFIGRRGQTYDLESHALNSNYLISMLFFGLLITFIYLNFAKMPTIKNALNTETFYFTFMSLPFFLAISYFLLPIATSRIGYYVTLLSIPFMGTLSINKSKNSNLINLIVITLVVLVYMYTIISSYRDGNYDCILGLTCDFKWFNPFE